MRSCVANHYRSVCVNNSFSHRSTNSVIVISFRLRITLIEISKLARSPRFVTYFCVLNYILGRSSKFSRVQTSLLNKTFFCFALHFAVSDFAPFITRVIRVSWVANRFANIPIYPEYEIKSSQKVYYNNKSILYCFYYFFHAQHCSFAMQKSRDRRNWHQINFHHTTFLKIKGRSKLAFE